MEPRPLGAGAEHSEWEEDEEIDKECLWQLSRCPACHRERDIILILPCSHTLCVRCVAAGERTRSSEPRHRSVGRPACSALCPACRGAVELPCWDWSSAASCLPKHPALSPARVGRETVPEDRLQQMSCHQEETRCSDAGDPTAQICLHGSNAASSPAAPVDDAVELREEEMEQSVFGLCFALDPSTVPPSLRLSKSCVTVTYQGGEGPAGPPPYNVVGRSMTSDPAVTLALPQVCADVVVTRGQYYWEVDVCDSSVYRIGVRSLDGSGAGWWLQRQGLSFCTVDDGSREPLCNVPPRIKTLGVFLNIGGGALSFHNPLTREHLSTLPTRFSPGGVLPALCLGHGRLRLRCGLAAPPHVFHGRDSAYRRPRGPAGGQWRGQTRFRSVRRVIRKFEELAASDSDSVSFASRFGSSRSTLGSLPDPGDSWGESPRLGRRGNRS